MLNLPAFELSFSRGGESLRQTVKPWPFTAGPLRELAIRKDEGGEYLRPDAKALPLDSQASRRLFWSGLLIALFAGLSLAAGHGLLPFFRNQNRFGKILKQWPKTCDAGRLKALHGVFDQLYGKVLAPENVSDFYRLRPEFGSVATELDWFFQCSRQYFFNSKHSLETAERERLLAFCQRLRAIEIGRA